MPVVISIAVENNLRGKMSVQFLAGHILHTISIEFNRTHPEAFYGDHKSKIRKYSDKTEKRKGGIKWD